MTKTFFFNLNDFSYFKVSSGKCIKKKIDHKNEILYWTSNNNRNYVTYLDFKLTQKIN